MGLDCEFSSLDTKTAYLSVLSLYNPKVDVSYALALNLYAKEDIIALLRQLKSIVAHNANVDISVIFSNYNVLIRDVYCTMVAAQVIDAGLGYEIKKKEFPEEFKNHKGKLYYTKNMIGNIPYMSSKFSLLSCLKRYLNITLASSSDKTRLQQSFIGLTETKSITEEQLSYACDDTRYLIKLKEAQEEIVIERSLQEQLKLEFNVLPVIVKMQQKGVLINTETLNESIKKNKKILLDIEVALDKELVHLSKVLKKTPLRYSKRSITEHTIPDLFGNVETISTKSTNHLNYESPTELKHVFLYLELPLPKDNKDEIGFGEEALNLYLNQYPDTPVKKFIALLLQHREYTKLTGTFGTKLLESLDSDSRLRTNYSQAFTSTGRLASSKITSSLGANLANIPKNGDLRKAFIPDPGYKFIDCDMTGQEVIITAAYSKEPVLLKAFNEGFDHHSFLASLTYTIIFKQKVEIVNENIPIVINNIEYNSKKLRDDHKTLLFAKFYLAGPKRCLTVMNKYIVQFHPPDDRLRIAEQISETLDKALPILTKYLKSSVTHVQQHGYVVTTKLGRRRYFDDPEKAYGDASNFNIQATGGMAMKLALYEIDQWFARTSSLLEITEDELGWVALSIYDQVLCCLHEDYIFLAKEIQEIMAQSLTFFLDSDLKGASDLNIRDYWGK